MSHPLSDALVSTEWLAAHLNAPDVRIVDASWYMPAQNIKAYDLYVQKHIPGAVFFDIDEVAAEDRAPLPHMMPDATKFSSKVRELGLGDGVKIVIYAQRGSAMAACRAWWMFRYFGHDDVAVLDGGLAKWCTENHPVTDRETPLSERHFSAHVNSMLLKDYQQILSDLDTRQEQIIDARSKDRFEGTVDDPWGKSGHMPGAFNLPFDKMYNEDGTFKDAESLKKEFAQARIDLTKPMVTSCGSGVTACVLAMGAYIAGNTQVAVYDGSWAEWASTPESPVETGPSADKM